MPPPLPVAELLATARRRPDEQGSCETAKYGEILPVFFTKYREILPVFP